MSRVALFGGLAAGAAAVVVAVTVGDGWLESDVAPKREDGADAAPATDVTVPARTAAPAAESVATATTDTATPPAATPAPEAPDAAAGSPTAGGVATEPPASPAPAAAAPKAPIVAQDDPAAPQPGSTAPDAPDLALAPGRVDTAPGPAGAPEAPGASADGSAMPETGVAMPAFDLVRAESDGSALVAGSAEPGARVEVLLGGAVAASTDGGRDGRFVVFLDLPDTGQAHVLALRQSAGDSVIVSLDEIIVAPRAAVATAAPEGDDPALPAPVDAEPQATPGVPASPELPGQIARIDAGQAGPAPDDAQAVDLPNAENTLARSRDMAAAIVAATPETPAPATAERDRAPETEQDPPQAVERPAPLALSPGREPAPDTDRSTDSTTMIVASSDADSDAADDVAPREADPDDRSGDGTGDMPAQAPASDDMSGPEAQTAASTDAGTMPAANTIAAAGSPGAESVAPQAPSAPSENATPQSPSAIGAPVDMAAAPAPEPAGEARPMVLRSTPQGVEVMPDAPLDPGQVALDQITYDDDGAVRVAGRGDAGGTGGGFVRLYLDNAPVATAQIAADGRWRTTLPEVDTGTYTLRVDRIDAGGAVTARAESPFRRVDPEVLEATRAAGGTAVNVTVQPGNTLWGISRARYGEGIDYVRIFDANRDQIRDPDLIYPGQIFDLPE